MGTHGGGGAGAEQREGITVDSILKAAAKRLLPAGREDVLGDARENTRFERFAELSSSVWAAWKTKTLRGLYPALAVLVDGPTPQEVRMRIDRTYRSVRRSVFLFVYASSVLGGVNAHLLPDVYHLQFFFALLAPLGMMGVRALHNAGFEGKGTPLGLAGISDAGYVRDLKRMVAVLIGGEFSPSKAALRSAIDVFVGMMLFFGPAYVTVRWFAGDPLPVDTYPAGLVWRLTVAVLMTLLFAGMRKSNQYAAQVMEDQIDALQAAMNSPVSA